MQGLAWWAAPPRVAVWVLVLAVAGGVLGYRWSERAGLAQLADLTSQRQELYALALEAELARYAYLPSLIAIDADILAPIEQPASAEARERASRRLARINARAGSVQILLATPGGRLLASSDSRRVSGAVGTDAAMEAALSKDIVADFFAANAGDGTTDYCFVHDIQRAGSVRGRVVVKVNLGPLEATWVDLGLRSQSDKVLVVDENGVVILSSVLAWKYRTLGAAHRGAAPAQARYASAKLLPLDIDMNVGVERGASLVRVAIEGSSSASKAPQLAMERPIVPLAARLLTLADPSEPLRAARATAWGGAAGGACLGLLALYAAYRRRSVHQLLQAGVDLRRAHDQLERQVDERTSELRAANEELMRQIAQRKQAENELIQASKLAVLGQMSAGISHEINQPLTALRALSRNTLLLFEGGRGQAVVDNLRMIDAMAERMGRIVTQLKSFARKSVGAGGTAAAGTGAGAGVGTGAVVGGAAAVDLAAAVRDALLLLEHRIRAEGVQVELVIAPGTFVNADLTRLEQVLLNLATNAVDAMQGSAQRRLRITAEPQGERTLVAVSDTGAGMDDASLQRVFEPFFTSKPAGEGLGLGLVISQTLVREFGGTLRAQRGRVGMRFEFDLPTTVKELHV
jgi:two-component system C4-dicarboxylate transport sensor histidine kinase DctB